MINTDRRTRRGVVTGPAARLPMALALALACFGLTACRDTQIRTYTVARERARPSFPTSEPDPTPPAASPTAEWQLPEGWRQLPGDGMRFATVVVEPADASPGMPALEIKVTPMVMAAGQVVGTVNRWRGQLGLDPIAATKLGSIARSISVDGHPVQLFDMTGVSKGGAPAQQVLAALVTSEPQVWFFYLAGDARRLSKYAAPFESFIKSVRLTGAPPVAQGMPAAGETPPGATPAGTMPQGTMPPGTMSASALPPGALPPAGSGETMTWTAPGDWTPNAKGNDMRVASFVLPGSGGEVAITRFPGDVGGLLANINRWRNQLALAPVGNPDEQPSENVNVAGQPARFFDISPPGADGSRKRMLVVLLARPDMTWFIKMTGPASMLDQQAGAFRQFLQTIRLEGAAG